MTARRPIVSVDGERQQLPAGDSLLGIPAYMPAIQYGGTLLKLAINLSSLTVIVGQYGGGSLSVPVAING
ncbi:hypothetical protein [Pseudomonas sp.]|uniref:hypothetical protein n=1 Tax=Pseudomonas sp. TaxID=306 RepID=UPI00257CE969|nr:hypothetical protein [Pseudomonas sp.]